MANIEISGQERLTLRRVIDRAPESQKAIAHQCALTEPWLSQLLPPKVRHGESTSASIEPRTVRNDQFERLVKLLAQRIRVGKISIPEEIQRDFQQIERRIGVAPLRPVYRSRPGDAVTAGSSLYVERAGWDDRLRLELAYAPDVRLCLYGPPGTGKQSALAWIVRDLKGAGIKVANFSGGLALYSGVDDPKSRVLTTIAHVARRDWKVHLPLPSNGCFDEVGELGEWISQASAMAGPSVLICDQLEKLDLDQQNPELYFAAVECARVLARIRSQDGETPGLIYCSEFQTGVGYQEEMFQKSGGKLAFVESHLMTERQIQALLTRLNELRTESRLSTKELDKASKLLFTAFEGHPEFTHRAFDRIGFPDQLGIPSLNVSDGINGCKELFTTFLSETPAIPTFIALMKVVKRAMSLASRDQALFLKANGLLRIVATSTDGSEGRSNVHLDPNKDQIVKTHVYEWLAEIIRNFESESDT